MASSSDQATGAVLLVIALVTFLYYTVWTLVLPFLPSSNPLQSYFPPRELAVFMPVALMVLGLSAIGAFYALTMRAAAAKKKTKAA